MAQPVEYLGPVEGQPQPSRQTQASAAFAEPDIPLAGPEEVFARYPVGEYAKTSQGRMMFPALGSVLGQAGASRFMPGLVGQTLGPGLGAAGGEALRETVAGEKLSPGRITKEGILAAVPAPLLRAAGPVIRGATRYVPGTSAALQERAVATARKAVESLPAPSAAGEFDALKKAFQSGVEQISVPKLAGKLETIVEELRPVIAGWKLSPNIRLQKAAEALEKSLTDSPTLPLDRLNQLMRDIGPRTQKLAGEAGGVLKAIYTAAKQSVQEAADAGNLQAQVLLRAQKMHRRYEAVQAATGAGETSSLREIVEKAIAPVEGTRGLEQITAKPVLEALPKLGRIAGRQVSPVAERLGEVLSAVEAKNLRQIFTGISQAPKIRTGIPGLAERLVLYILMAGAGYQFGGAPGIVASAAGAEALRRSFMTPTGMRIIQRLATAAPGAGLGTRLAQTVLPALGGTEEPAP